jgi:putative membrane protein
MKHDEMSGKNAADRDFVMKAAQASMAEIKMGQAALQNASSADVKSFAQRMIDDHIKANTELLAMAQQKGITVPPMLTSKDMSAMEKMSKRTGADFDRDYMMNQVKAHEAASALFTKESASGADPDFKAFAAKYLPAINEHLEMARNWTKSGAGAMDHSGDK